MNVPLLQTQVSLEPAFREQAGEPGLSRIVSHERLFHSVKDLETVAERLYQARTSLSSYFNLFRISFLQESIHGEL